MTHPYANLDIDIRNYSDSDILDLFQITDLTPKSIAIARKKMRMAHPDKSKLPKEYFDFFQKAFVALEELELHHHQEDSTKDYNLYVEKIEKETGFDSELMVSQLSHDLNMDIKTSTVMPKSFNEKFNQMFDTMNIDDRSGGYNSWFDSNPEHDYTICDKDQLTKIRSEQNPGESSLIGVNFEQGICDDLPYSTLNAHHDSTNYSSGQSSELMYTDLKETYSNTLLNMVNDDYDLKPTMSIDEYKRIRTQADKTIIDGMNKQRDQKKNNRSIDDSCNPSFTNTESMEPIRAVFDWGNIFRWGKK